nr:PAS domain-containing protein [Pseudomonadota bacterium]
MKPIAALATNGSAAGEASAATGDRVCAPAGSAAGSFSFGHFIVDADLRLVEASAGAQAFFETDQPVVDCDLGELMQSMGPVSFATDTIGRFRRVLATREAYRGTSTARRHDRDADVAYDLQIEPLGRPDRGAEAICHFYALPERLHVTSDLEASESRYRLAVSAGRMGSWETNFSSGIRTWSPEGTALFGLALADGLGKVGGADDEYSAAVHPDDRHLVAAYRELADRVDSFAAEYRIVRPDGRMLWLSGRGQVVERHVDGRAVRLVSIMADISERKQAEVILRVERERLSLALDAGRMGVYEFEVASDTVWWSRQTYDVFGVDPKGFSPTRESINALIHPDDREESLRERSEAIAKHRSFSHEFRVVRADGTIAWIVTRGEAKYDANGAVVRTYGVSADITERKRMEAALREADRRKDEFLATLAHELRNPLAPIRNGLHVLRHADPTSPARQRAQSLMERQLEHMVRLIDDLMDVSRINNGMLELRTERLQLTTVLNSAVEAARPMIEEMGHELKVALAATAVAVEADLTRLAQVFTNLLNNAAKYTEKGGHIGLEVRKKDGEVWVSVSDDGIGLTAEQLPRVFAMFTPVDRSLSRSHGGLGIGLSLVKRLVEMHGGRVDARSEGLGRGSEFEVRLPLAAEALAPS